MSHRPLLLPGLLALTLAGSFPAGAGEESPPTEGWRAFAGSWSVSGHRQAVEIEGGGRATIVEVSGAVVLSSGEDLSRGFRGQAIGFDDGHGLSIGRAVWTDANGDQLFSRLEGEPLQTGKRFRGTITGGTGRYAAVEGEYTCTWQYLVPADVGEVQGRAVSLVGRIRRAEGAR